MAELDICKLAKACLSYLETLAFTVEETADFSWIERQMPGIGKKIISPTMKSGKNDFTEARAFWLTMHDPSGLVAVMGMRLDALGRESVDAFWQRAFARQYRSASDTKVDLQLPQVVRLISGQIVYMGDLFFVPRIRGDRATLMCFVHLAHALCFLKWQHDWTYAFHRREDVLSGYSDRYGFNNRWPGAQLWTNPPDYRTSDEYLSVLSREEFEQKASYYARNPDLLTQADPRAESKAKPKNSR